MSMLRNNFTPLLEKTLRAVYQDEFDLYPDVYPQVFNVLSSTKPKETDESVGGFGMVPPVGEGAAITYDITQMGYQKIYTHIKYGLGYKVSQELIDDDQYSKITKLTRSLANSARYTIEQKAADIFNYGFATSYSVGGDSKALFATNHPLKGGGTYANKPSTDVGLTGTSLQAAIVNMRLTPNDEGQIRRHMPKVLVVPTSLQFKAEELLNSTLSADTGNNNINSLKTTQNIKIVVWDYLTDQDAWFLMGDKHFLNFFWRKKMEQQMERDFDTDSLKHKLLMRFSLGFSDWRGTYGSSGG